jgi:hypothetical protein
LHRCQPPGRSQRFSHISNAIALGANMIVQNNSSGCVILTLLLLTLVAVALVALGIVPRGPVASLYDAQNGSIPDSGILELTTYLLIILTILIFGLILLSIYAFRRGFTNISYSCDIELANPHVVSFVTSWGMLRDRLDILVDQNMVMSDFASSWYSMLHGESLYQFLLDTQQMNLRWKWSLWGDPLYILLESQGNLIAKYGNEKAIKKVSDSFPKRALAPKSIIKTHLFEEIEFRDSVSTLNSEEYVLDNRHGSESMEVEQEISKTITSSLTIEESNLAQLAITAGITGVIQGQITKDLSKRLGVAIGESLSKRHTFRFSVRPGDAVVYTILWKSRVRTGAYNFLIDGERRTLPYQVQYDLLYEIDSKPYRLHKKDKARTEILK